VACVCACVTVCVSQFVSQKGSSVNFHFVLVSLSSRALVTYTGVKQSKVTVDYFV